MSPQVDEALATMIAEFGDRPEFDEFVASLKEGEINSPFARSHVPVSIQEFLEDDYFMGEQGRNLWTEVKESIIDVVEGGHPEAIFTGAIGIAKTTKATIITAYHLYVLSCWDNPQRAVGLMESTDITFVMMNKTEYLATSVTYKRFRALIESIPYFNEQFPFNKHKESMMDFPKNIQVIPAAANNDKMLGMNVIGGIGDELNFMEIIAQSKRSVTGGEYDQASEIYTALARRRKSRFMNKGKVSGCLCLVSSKNYEDDFTDRRVKKLRAEGDTLTYIHDKAQWEVLPPERFSWEMFMVAVGTTRHPSKILEEGEKLTTQQKVLEVPIEYYDDFKDDIVGALKDLAGVTVGSTNSYFWDRDKLWNVPRLYEAQGLPNVFDFDRICLDAGLPTLDDVNEDYVVPNRHVPRAVHIDLAHTGDRCGFAVGHVSDIVEISSRDHVKGTISGELAPVITYDLTVEIAPPAGGEIEFAEVRQLLYFLRDEVGIPIKWVSFDNFQSIDSRQILRRRGFKTRHLSVEGDEAYQTLRTAVWQERVLAKEHPLLMKELGQLQKNPKTGKVDHPPNGSKDVADAMCGTYVNLLGKRQAWRGMAEFEAITAAELSEEKDGGDDTQHKERRLQKKRREVKRR